jgi:hypothetical protein
MAYAQTPPPGERPFEPVRVEGSGTLRPGVRNYVRSSASAYSGMMPIGAVRIEMQSIVHRGDSAWRVVTTRPLEPMPKVDTAVLRKRDLRLLWRRFHWASVLLAQEAVGDTALVQTSTTRLPPGVRLTIDPSRLTHRSIVRVDSARPMVADETHLMLLLRALPLRDRWQGSIQVNLDRISPLMDARTRTINLSVQGDSVVPTLWGRVPAWRVVLHTGANPHRYYVSKEGHEILLVTGPEAASANAPPPRHRVRRRATRRLATGT